VRIERERDHQRRRARGFAAARCAELARGGDALLVDEGDARSSSRVELGDFDFDAQRFDRLRVSAMRADLAPECRCLGTIGSREGDRVRVLRLRVRGMRDRDPRGQGQERGGDSANTAQFATLASSSDSHGVENLGRLVLVGADVAVRRGPLGAARRVPAAGPAFVERSSRHRGSDLVVFRSLRAFVRRRGAESATPATTASQPTPLRTPEEKRDFDRFLRAKGAVEKRVQASGYASLSSAEKTLYVIWWLEAEVNNGGFDQYFFNSAGDNARDVPPALERIGAPVTAALVRRTAAGRVRKA
jgi:hypothetical protein